MPYPSCSLHYRVFYAPKRGNELRHYEDAFALAGVEPVGLHDPSSTYPPTIMGALQPEGEVWRCAVADGATQGGFSRWWAQVLVEAYLQDAPILKPSLEGMDAWLRTMAQRWNTEKIHEILQTVPQGSPRYARMQQSLLLEGQAATLVMLELDLLAMRWRSAAFGDAFVFHCGKAEYRGKDILGVLPTRPFSRVRSTDLDSNPILISTREANQAAWIWGNPAFRREDAYAEGSFEVGDRFVLMTDAVAGWFLRILEQDDPQLLHDELHHLLRLPNNQAFNTDWLTFARSQPTHGLEYIKNDDVTIAIIEIMVENVKAVPVKRVQPRQPHSAITHEATPTRLVLTRQAPLPDAQLQALLLPSDTDEFNLIVPQFPEPSDQTAVLAKLTHIMHKIRRVILDDALDDQQVHEWVRGYCRKHRHLLTEDNRRLWATDDYRQVYWQTLIAYHNHSDDHSHHRAQWKSVLESRIDATF
jgi:hypothetical protein